MTKMMKIADLRQSYVTGTRTPVDVVKEVFARIRDRFPG